MKLFFHYPKWHGPDALFIVAETPEDAAAAVNSYLEKKSPGAISDYGVSKFAAEHFEVADPGVVVAIDR